MSNERQSPKSPKQPDPELKNEGEGSSTATRRYDANAESAAKDKKKTEQLAQAAKKALEGPDGADLRKAEERGKRGEHR
jgi:hypothetical protein